MEWSAKKNTHRRGAGAQQLIVAHSNFASRRPKQFCLSRRIERAMETG